MMLDDYKVPNSNIKVSMALPLANEDISGQTASTENVTKGNKAKKLDVSLTIRFDNAAELTRLLTIAEKTDSNGAAWVYTIVDPLAQASNMRQVRFVDNFRITEADQLQAWQINFQLSEHNSVPQKKEQRQTAAEPATQQAPGETVTTAQQTEAAPAIPEQAEPDSFMVNALRQLDKWLA